MEKENKKDEPIEINDINNVDDLDKLQEASWSSTVDVIINIYIVKLFDIDTVNQRFQAEAIVESKWFDPNTNLPKRSHIQINCPQSLKPVLTGHVVIFQVSLDANVRDRILDGLADVADMMEDTLQK